MKTKWRIFLGIIVLVILYFLLRNFDFAEVWKLISEANNFYFALAFLTYGIALLIYSARLRYVIKNVVKTKFSFILRVTLAGIFVGTIVPTSQASSDPVKAHFIGKKYKKKRSGVFGAILADRLYHGITTFLFVILSGFFAFTFLPLSQDIRHLLQGIFFFLLSFILFILIIYSFRKEMDFSDIFAKITSFLRKKMIKKNPKSKLGKIFAEHFDNFFKTFKKTFFNKKIASVAFLLSIIFWLLNFLIPYFLFLSFGYQVSFLLVMMAASVGIAFAEIGITPGGTGLIEGGIFFTYTLAGIPPTLALAVTLLTRVIFYIYSGMGGLSLIELERNVG